MPALNVKEEAAGQLIMQSSRLPNLSTLLSALFAVAVFFYVIFSNVADLSRVIFWLVFLFMGFGGTIFSMLQSHRVVIDPFSRIVTIQRRLLTVPIQSIELAFKDLQTIRSELYRQSEGRRSHDAWRVNAVAKDGRIFPLNWDGKKEEMEDLARRIAKHVNVPVNENPPEPVPLLQQPLDTASTASSPQVGEGEEKQWEAEEQKTARPDLYIPFESEPTTTRELPTARIGTADELGTEAPVRQAPQLRTLTIDSLEKRIAEDRMDAEARFVLAGKYHDRNELDRALAMYQEALRLEPANAAAQNDLAVALQQRGKRSEAETAYRRAAALDPFSSITHLNLALLLRTMNRATEASQEFFLARQNAQSPEEQRAAESASTGGKMEPRRASARDKTR